MGSDGTIEVTTRIEVEAAPAPPAAAAHSEIELPSEFRSVVLTAILTIMMFYTLYFARAVIVPMLLALMIRLFLQLPLNLLTRLGMPRIFAVVVVMLCFLGMLGGLGSTLGGPASEWIAKAPSNFSRIQDRMEFIKRPLQELQNTARRIESVVESPPNASTVTLAGPSLGGLLAANTQSLVRGIGIVLLLLFFLLAGGDTFKRRLVEILPRLSDKKHAVEIVNEVEDSVSGYLLTITVINAGLGILTGFTFWFCGMPAPTLWGAIAFSFNYVPFVGPLCAIAIFALAGLFTFESNWFAMLPVGIYVLLILLEGQVVTPMVLARRFSLNPVAVVVSLVFWFWMWGTPGALLAVPMLATFKIVCDHVGPLNAIGHFLEG